MRARIVLIGNSRGIRIPKAVMQQCEMSDAVDLAIKVRQIIVSPVRERPRQDWREAAARMSAASDDELLIPDVFEDDGRPRRTARYPSIE